MQSGRAFSSRLAITNHRPDALHDQSEVSIWGGTCLPTNVFFRRADKFFSLAEESYKCSHPDRLLEVFAHVPCHDDHDNAVSLRDAQDVIPAIEGAASPPTRGQAKRDFVAGYSGLLACRAPYGLTQTVLCLCSDAPTSRTRDHLVPLQLWEMTVRPNRVVSFGQNYAKGKKMIAYHARALAKLVRLALKAPCWD